MNPQSSWVTFEQPDGTHAGLICPDCAAMAPYHTLENERAIPVTTEIDGQKCCAVCDIEFRCYQEAEAVIRDMDEASKMDLLGWIGRFIVGAFYIAIVIFTLFAFFNLL